MAKRFILDHKMMSICLLDSNFYKVAGIFEPVHEIAQREWDIRKQAINSGSKSGCSSCGKKRASRVRKEMERRHGALFTQRMGTVLESKPNHKFEGLKIYVKQHIHALTGKNVPADFDTVVVYVPIKNASGNIEVTEVEI
jgi:hypothetical protein